MTTVAWLTAALVALAAAWSIIRVRDWVLDLLRLSLDDDEAWHVAKVFTGLALVGTTALAMVEARRDADDPPRAVARPVAGPVAGALTACLAPAGVARHTARTAVRGALRDERGNPIIGATIKVAQDEVLSGKAGTFRLALAATPDDETLVRIQHPGYRTRFFRFDDPALAGEWRIDLQPKMRLLVVERDGGDGASAAPPFATLRSQLESRLKGNEIDILADAPLRQEVVRQLRQYQRERALYRPAMLQRIGEFSGATHAVFYRVRPSAAGQWEFESALVDLGSTEQLATYPTTFTDAQRTAVDLAGSASSILLAGLASAKIVSPRTESHCGHMARVEGFVANQPPGWDLWLTLQPEGNAAQFPQERITVNSDGSWIGSAVYLGDSQPPTAPLRYRINAVITRGAQTALFDKYLTSRQFGGIPGAALRPEDHRVLHFVDVVRTR